MTALRGPRSPVPSLALFALLGGCAFASGDFTIVGRTPELHERAERVIRVPLDVAGIERAELDVGFGDVEATAGEGESEVVAELELWARTKEDAVRALDGFEVVAGRSGSTVSVRLRGEPLVYEDGATTMRVWPRARLKARLPKGLAVAAKSASGDVRVQGPFGASELSSAYGRIVADGVAGLVATTGSGDVDARRIGGEVRLRSSYGTIELTEAQAQRVTIETGSGDVRMRQVAAATTVATSRYGAIEARQSKGDLRLETTSGSIAVEAAGEGRHRLETGYGRVTVRGGAGELSARSNSGDVEVAEFAGSARLGTKYGEIEAQGVFTGLHARSDSGAVQVTAADGSKAGAPWHLSSGYGSVELDVPADFGCELFAATDHGRVTADVRVTTAPGGAAGQSLRGTIGGGGSRVDLTSRSGDVRLRARAAAPSPQAGTGR